MNNTIYVLCDTNLFYLMKPLEVSKVILDDNYNDYCVALFKKTELLKITEKDCEDNNAWWREIGRANISIDNSSGLYGKGYKPRIMRKVGLLTYICDQYGLSQPRNVAAMIGEISFYEGKNPIEFFNSIHIL